MAISTNIYEYETRPVTPQECVPAPTIRIAYQDVTMNDMFTRPEYVSNLKELQEIIYIVQEQVHEIRQKGMVPTAIIIDRKTEHLIMRAPNGVYNPRYMTRKGDTDTFMGLEIAVNHGQRDTQYIRVVV